MANFCRSCDAKIKWVRTDGGKRMPLDAEPHAEGTIFILGRRNREVGRVLLGDALEEARERGEALYRSHFATCPHAEDWRKG